MGLVSKLFHRKPITSMETTTPATTHTKPWHDVDARISIHDHERRRRSASSSNLNETSCSNSSNSHCQKKKKHGWWRPLIKNEQRQLSHKAYRMAILASLAYHDFCNDLMHHDANHLHENRTLDTWAFSLLDNPPPAPYLIYQSRQKRKTRKQRNAPLLLLEVIARFQVSTCQIQSEFDCSRRQWQNLVEKKSTTSAFNNPMQQRMNGTIITEQCKYNVLKKHKGRKH